MILWRCSYFIRTYALESLVLLSPYYPFISAVYLVDPDPAPKTKAPLSHFFPCLTLNHIPFMGFWYVKKKLPCEEPRFRL